MKALLGNSPLTTLLGILAAALVVAKDLMEAGETNTWTIVTAVGLAVFGRLVKGEDEAPKDVKL